jgi:hypothetical protein
MIQPKHVESLQFANEIQTLKRTISVERRRGEDRRKKELPIFSKYWLTGKREVFRREDDSRIYDKVDRYSPKTLAIILIILMLSTIDAIFTLELINEGATELNPLMAYYLNHGPLVFFWAKYTLTCASTLLIFFNQNLYIFKNRVPMKVLYIFIIIPYALVVQWELYLIFFINR